LIVLEFKVRMEQQTQECSIQQSICSRKPQLLGGSGTRTPVPGDFETGLMINDNASKVTILDFSYLGTQNLK
jgi:hypothetical protein